MAVALGTGTTSAGVGTAGIALNRPTGTTNGELLLVTILRLGTLTDPITVPTGWNLVAATTSVSNRSFMYYKIASAEPTSWTWIWSAAAASGTIGNAFRYTGNGDAASQTVVAAIGTNSNSATLTSPSVTLARPGGMYVCMVNTGSSSALNTWSSTAVTPEVTLGNTTYSSAANTQGAFGDLARAAAGATGTKAWTTSVKITGLATAWAIEVQGGPTTWSGVADVPIDLTGIAADGTVTTFDFPAISPILQTRIPS